MNLNIDEIRQEACNIYDNAIKQSSLANEARLEELTRNRKKDKILNIFWIIFIGIWNSILTACLGVVQCLTIVGIPAGIISFKSIKLIFAPTDKRVELNFGKHPVLNIIWLILGGLEISLYYLILGIVLCSTIVFIPIGVTCCKFAKFYLAPFGAKVVNKYEFETEEDKIIIYSYQHKKRNEVKEKQEILKTLDNEKDIKTFLKQNLPFKSNEVIKNFIFMAVILIIVLIPVATLLSKFEEYYRVMLNGGELNLLIFVPIMLFGSTILIFSISPLMSKTGCLINSFYGYISIDSAVVYLKHMNQKTRKEYLEYYNLNKEEIDELIELECLSL